MNLAPARRHVRTPHAPAEESSNTGRVSRSTNVARHRSATPRNYRRHGSASHYANRSPRVTVGLDFGTEYVTLVYTLSTWDPKVVDVLSQFTNDRNAFARRGVCPNVIWYSKTGAHEDLIRFSTQNKLATPTTSEDRAPYPLINYIDKPTLLLCRSDHTQEPK